MDFDKSGPTAEKNISQGGKIKVFPPNLYLKNSGKRPFI